MCRKHDTNIQRTFCEQSVECLGDIFCRLRCQDLGHVQRSDDLQVPGKKKHGGQAKIWEACV